MGKGVWKFPEMKAILVLLAASLLYVEAKNCDKLGVLVYEDLACKPKDPSAEGGCPSGFDCEEAMHPGKKHCRLNGRTFDVGETVDNDLTYASCNVGCHCGKPEEGDPSFHCAVLDCPEWLGVPVKPGCRRKYELGKCCSTGEVCPPFDESIVCKVDGETYKEGQKFTPKGTCLDCVCQKGFKGEFIEPFCQRQSCGEEVRHARQVEEKCAPVHYFGEDEVDRPLCCPSSWACPPSADLALKPNPEGDAEKSCKFGENTVRGNEQFAITVEHFGNDRKIECKCVMPPLVSCVGKW